MSLFQEGTSNYEFLLLHVLGEWLPKTNTETIKYATLFPMK